MSSNPQRNLAAHVQAAVTRGEGVGQAKMGEQGGGRGGPAHVKASVAAGQGVGQAMMKGQGGGRGVAAQSQNTVAPKADVAAMSSRHAVQKAPGSMPVQAKWGWWKNRHAGDYTYYDNGKYPFIHVTWNKHTKGNSHVTYEHKNGDKSTYYPFQHVSNYYTEDAQIWCHDAWDDFKLEYKV